MKAAHGVDFEDIYFSEIFAWSEPQNTPTTKFFCGLDPQTLTGSAPMNYSYFHEPQAQFYVQGLQHAQSPHAQPLQFPVLPGADELSNINW